MPLDPSIYNPLLNMPNWAQNAGNSLAQGYQLGTAIKEAPIRNRLLEAQAQSAEHGNNEDLLRMQYRELTADWPALKNALETGDMTRANQLVGERIGRIQKRGGDPSDTIRFWGGIASGEISPQEAIADMDAAIAGAERAGFIGSGQGVGQQEFENLISGFTPEEQEKARRIKAGLSPRAQGSGALTIAESGKTQDVAESQATIKGAESGASEQAKSDVQLEMKPKIQAAVKEAETAAKSRGETLTEYSRAKAALPGLQEVVGKLKALSDVATYTVGGRAFDQIVKQMGFGATEGSTARAKMQSLVDNQILPLLRETFGAAFTKEEGDRLRATMLDIDASPEEKKATLDTFLDQKMRNLEAKERELGQQSSGTFTSSSGIQFTVE